MADSPQSLRSLYGSGNAQRKTLESAIGTSSPEYQKDLQATITTFEACQRLVEQASLFSRNETVDDIPSGDLEYDSLSCRDFLANWYHRYLLIDYYLAELALKTTGSSRLEVLEKARQLYESYLERLDVYGILSPQDRKLYERFLEDRKWFSFASQTDAAARRQVKVARYQEEKAVKQKLEVRITALELLTF
jgi:immunoglobulin-binding protein 1